MDIGTLRIAVDARQATQATRELDGLSRQAAKTEQATVRMARQSGEALGSMRGFLVQVGGTLAALNLAQQFIRVADSVTVLNNQLKLAMGSAKAADQAYTDLYRIAQASRVSFTDLGATFAQIRRATEDAGLSYSRLLTVTEAIGNAMAVSGGSAAGMNAALIQLQQGLASGTLRGEELNSVMEQTPRLAQAIADGLGVTRGELRALGQDGKLTSEAVIRALESQAAVLKGEVANSTLTYGQAMTKAANAVTLFIGEVDDASGASSQLAELLVEFSNRLDTLSMAFRTSRSEAGSFSKMLGTGLSVVLETVTVLAVNVSYVLKSIGREIGGIAAQAAAFASGDFAGAANIGRMMREDAVRARNEVDAATTRILNSRRVAASLEGAEAYNEPRFARALKEQEQGVIRVAQAIKGKTSATKDLVDIKKRNMEMDNLVMRVILDNEEKIAKAIAKTQEEAAKAYADNLKIYEDAAKSAQDRVSAMELENEAIELAQRLQISMARAVELTTIARLKEKQVAAMGDEAAVLAIQREIDAREKLVQMMEGREIKEASEKLRRDEESAWAKTWEQISQSFTDELLRGGKSIAEYLKNLFKTLVLRPIIDPIGKGLVGILSGGGGTAMAGQGGVGGAFNIISSLQGAYSQLTGGLATTLSGVGSAVGSIGAAMQYGTTAFSQQSMMLAAQEAGMGTTAGTMGTAATALGGALVGFMAGKMISGGYSAIGKSGNASTAAGTAIGFAVGGPIGAAIGGALGGVFNRAFGRKAPVTTGQGITGTFSTSGADVAQFEDWFSKGGWFRSNKSGRNYSSVSSELDMFLDDSLRQITAATREYASVLGLNAKAIDGITQSVTLNMMGMNAEQQQAEIAKALGGFGDRLAQELLGAQAGKFVRAGETAGDALARMGQSLIAVNTVFDTLNQRLMETSLRGGDAASSLIEAFGSLENFTNATTAYYNAFYTEQERTATTTRQLTQALAQMGIALPATRDQFRAIVEAQDLYTDSGRATYAALLQLAPAFDVVMQAADRAAEDAKRAADAFAETMKRLGSSISDEVRRLRGLLVTDSPQARAALEAQFAMTTAQARAGDQSALERLPGISQALEQAAMMTARSAADVARMRGWLAGSMSETLKLLGLDVPQFAVGTNYVPRDTLAMIHEGEAIVPKAYNPAANGGDDVAFEMRALREEVSMLRHEARATALNTDKARRIWERVTRDGESMQVTVTP